MSEKSRRLAPSSAMPLGFLQVLLELGEWYDSSDRDAPGDFISPASPASSKHKLVCEDADKGDDRQRPSATIGNGHRQRSARAIGKSHRQRSATAIGNDRQEPSAATWLRTALRPHEHRPSPRFSSARWRRLNVMEAARSTCTMSSKTGMLFDDIARRCRNGSCWRARSTTLPSDGVMEAGA